MKDTTVIICCAGMGTRLCIGLPKSLLSIGNKPLIVHQLEVLKECEDVRIVIGYRPEDIISIVKTVKKDVMFAFNYDFDKTGPAASACKAMINTKKYVLIIDGDLVINKDDFKNIINTNGEFICITDIRSTNPILLEVTDGYAKSFSTFGNFEWNGIIKLEATKFNKSNEHVYDMFSHCFPIKTLFVRSRDIDTQEDYENAVQWYNEGCIE